MKAISRSIIALTIATVTQSSLVTTSTAQIVPSVSTTIRPCDEFATNELKNPWDMSDSSDVNYFTPNDIASISELSIGTGLFSGTSTLTAGGHFYLLSPQVASTQPVGGRWGQNNPIDVSTYRFLTVRMSLAEADPSGGLRVLFNRGTNYSDARTFTTAYATRPGWYSTSIDLASASIDPTSANTNPWSTGSITGFGIYPSVKSQRFSIDFIRLENPSSCGSTTASYSAQAVGSNTLMNLYIDDNSTPFDGYYSKLVTAATASSGTVTLSSLGLPPANYKFTGILSSDYATLELDDAWDMDTSNDITITGGISNATFASGVFSGTATTTTPTVFLRIAPSGQITTSKYSQLSLKISKASRDAINVFWTGGGVTLFPGTADPDQDNVWTANLSTVPSWTGTVSDFIIQPTVTVGNTFQLDFVALRNTGFVTSDTLPTAAVSSGNLTVAAPPIVAMIQPDQRGGEALRPWNFLPDDLDFSLNTTTVTDPSTPTESSTTYLPDVRLVQGRRGDFFKGTNIAGNDDPNDFLLFPFTTENNFTIDAASYHNMCLTMAVDKEFDLALGSVSKLFYGKVGQSTEEFDAWVTIYDRWSGNKWYEYCSDLTQHPREDGVKTWGGTVDLFRIDPHEFHLDTCCDNTGNPTGNPISATYYYDSLKLRKDDTSNGRFALVYSLLDPDSTSPSVSFFHNATNSRSGATSISAADLSCEGLVCIWNTSSVPQGRYFVLATASDGLASTTAISSGVVKVVNDSTAPALIPRLEVESPTQGQTVCSSVQFKGYALVENRFEDISAVQVFVDNQFFAILKASQYSPRARAAFPSADSSNSGFNELQAAGALSAGAHTIKVVAYASDGTKVSQDIAITKSNSCSDPAPVADSDPAGSPSPARVMGEGAGTPTPSPTRTPSGGSSLRLKGSHSTAGALALSISGATSKAASCSLALSIGTSADSMTPLKSFSFVPSKLKNGTVQLRGANIAVARAQVPSLLFSAKTTCGSRTASSTAVAVNFRTKTGLSSTATVTQRIKKALRIASRR